MEIKSCDYLADKGIAVVFREWTPRGSLRDKIYSVHFFSELRLCSFVCVLVLYSRLHLLILFVVSSIFFLYLASIPVCLFVCVSNLQASPEQPYARKYIRGHMLQPGEIALLGRQILEVRVLFAVPMCVLLYSCHFIFCRQTG